MTDDTDAVNANRYQLAAHAMQSGVALDIARNGEGGAAATPKHLRVGVNVALRDHGSLVKLLIDKGVITKSEYIAVIADGMEAEAKGYQEHLKLPPNVQLG